MAIPGSIVLYRWLGLEFEGSSGVSVNMLFHAFLLLVHGPPLFTQQRIDAPSITVEPDL